jgi:hypothetical protein
MRKCIVTVLVQQQGNLQINEAESEGNHEIQRMLNILRRSLPEDGRNWRAGHAYGGVAGLPVEEVEAGNYDGIDWIPAGAGAETTSVSDRGTGG